MKNDYVIIAAKNEEKHIGKVIDAVFPYCRDIIVVDDGSSDKTGAIAKAKGAIVLTHIINLGKGAAMKTGCDYAVSIGARNLILVDADGQHDPSEIPKFLLKLKKSDIVFGVRRFNKKMPIVLRFGNWFITKTTEVLFSIKVSDTQCGYRAFSASTYKKVRWNARDYSMESEMIANTGRNKLKYSQCLIETIYSDKYKGTTVFDGVKIVFDMIYWRIAK